MQGERSVRNPPTMSLGLGISDRSFSHIAAALLMRGWLTPTQYLLVLDAMIRLLLYGPRGAVRRRA